MQRDSGYARFSRTILAGLLVCGMAGCISLPVRRAKPLPENAVPPVIAVSSFDNRSSFAGQWKLGDGMADLLVSELLQSRNFVVVERGNIKNVVSEIDRQKDKRFRPEGRVERGRLKNARYLIRGVINDFSQVGGGSLWFNFTQILFLGRAYKARVAMTLTIVDIETGEIIKAVSTAGTARARQAYAQSTYKGVAFGGDIFFRTPLGVATSAAIRRGVNQIIEEVPRVYWEPMIAEVSAGNSMILNGGENRGLEPGMVYDVRTAGRPVTDPATGDILSVLPGKTIGRVRISRVLPAVSYAIPVSGSGFQRGQRLFPVASP